MLANQRRSDRCQTLQYRALDKQAEIRDLRGGGRDSSVVLDPHDVFAGHVDLSMMSRS